MSHELFKNVRDLYEQISCQWSERSPDDGPGAQMSVCTSMLQLLAWKLTLLPGVLRV
jgi:hypothetical protein